MCTILCNVYCNAFSMFYLHLHPLHLDTPGPSGFVKHNLHGARDKNNDNNNKAFAGLGSCDKVQTERSIFEYENWPKLQNQRTGPSSWSV